MHELDLRFRLAGYALAVRYHLRFRCIILGRRHAQMNAKPRRQTQQGMANVVAVADISQLESAQSAEALLDRKSTRLNSSHGYISYAVFCLKKKKTKSLTTNREGRGNIGGGPVRPSGDDAGTKLEHSLPCRWCRKLTTVHSSRA